VQLTDDGYPDADPTSRTIAKGVPGPARTVTRSRRGVARGTPRGDLCLVAVEDDLSVSDKNSRGTVRASLGRDLVLSMAGDKRGVQTARLPRGSATRCRDHCAVPCADAEEMGVRSSAGSLSFSRDVPVARPASRLRYRPQPTVTLVRPQTTERLWKSLMRAVLGDRTAPRAIRGSEIAPTRALTEGWRRATRALHHLASPPRSWRGRLSHVEMSKTGHGLWTCGHSRRKNWVRS